MTDLELVNTLARIETIAKDALEHPDTLEWGDYWLALDEIRKAASSAQSLWLGDLEAEYAHTIAVQNPSV